METTIDPQVFCGFLLVLIFFVIPRVWKWIRGK